MGAGTCNASDNPGADKKTKNHSRRITITRYTVANTYSVGGGSNHRSAAAAIREGDGWIVVDQDGTRYDINGGSIVSYTV